MKQIARIVRMKGEKQKQPQKNADERGLEFAGRAEDVAGGKAVAR